MARFFDRNISMFTLLGNNLARCGSTMYPLELNTHSDGTLAPQIQRYFLTSTESNENLLLFCFHQSKGSLLVSFQDSGKPLSFLGGVSSSSSRVGGFLLSATAAVSDVNSSRVPTLSSSYSALNLGSKKEYLYKSSALSGALQHGLKFHLMMSFISFISPLLPGSTWRFVNKWLRRGRRADTVTWFHQKTHQ